MNKDTSNLSVEQTLAQLEIRKFEFEKEFKSKQLDISVRSAANHGITAPQAALGGALLALLSGVIGAGLESESSDRVSSRSSTTALKIEETKVEGTLALEEAKQISAAELARLEFETSLILRAIETENREEAIRNLRFFVEAGFISDDDQRIANLGDDDLPSIAISGNSECPQGRTQEVVQGRLQYPASNTGIPFTARPALQVAVNELNAGVHELCNSDRVGDYWNVLGPDFAHLDGSNWEFPWGSAFTSFLLARAGSGHGIALSSNTSTIWDSAFSAGLTFQLEDQKPRPGDFVFRVRSGREEIVSQIAEGQREDNWPGHSGIIFSVSDEDYVMISGNDRDAVRQRIMRFDDDRIVGFVRLP